MFEESRSFYPETGDGEKALQRFRSATGGSTRHPEFGRRRSVPRRQKVLVGAILVWFATTSFSFRGGLDWIGFTISLFMGVATFLLLFLPLDEGEDPLADAAPSANLRRLLRFPMFWLGLYVLIYCGIQIWNIGWYYRSNGDGSATIVKIPHIEWLPSGGRVPYHAESTPYRSLLQIMVPWLMVCVVSVGIRSRRAWRWLSGGVLALSTVWSLMALCLYYTDQTHYFGIYMGRNNLPAFWGSIVNPNHAAFFQLLAAFLAVGLAFFAWSRSRERREGSVMGSLLFCLGLFFTFATFQSASRGAIAILLVSWVLLAPAAFFWGKIRGMRAVMWGASAVCVLVVASFFVMLIFLALGSRDRALKAAWEQTVSQLDSGWDSKRIVLNRIGWRYFESFAPFGSGLGTWRYRYPKFIETKEEGDVFRPQRGWNKDQKTGKSVRRYRKIIFWYAHNDWLQALCELGWAGAGALYLLLGWPFFWMLKKFRRSAFWGWGFLAGAFSVGLGSVYEFPMRTPAVSLFVALLMGLAIVEVQLRNNDIKVR